VDYSVADDFTQTALKVIADHIRAVVYLVSDGVVPSNLGRGYIVRRLLRRVILKGRLLGIKIPFAATVAEVAISMSGECDPQARDPPPLGAAGLAAPWGALARSHCASRVNFEVEWDSRAPTASPASLHSKQRTRACVTHPSFRLDGVCGYRW
jgi:hypothetical protein